MHRQALIGYEKALGVDHPATFTSVNNLGRVLDSPGKYEEAKVMIHRRALAGKEKGLGIDHPDTLYCAGTRQCTLATRFDLFEGIR